MNKRINELFGQALDQAVPETWTTLTPAQLSKLKDKFAELIVRECIERVRSQYIPLRDSTVEGSPNFFHPQLKVRTEREEGVIECGVNSVIALEELIQEQTDKWYEENILGVES